MEHEVSKGVCYLSNNQFPFAYFYSIFYSSEFLYFYYFFKRLFKLFFYGGSDLSLFYYIIGYMFIFGIKAVSYIVFSN